MAAERPDLPRAVDATGRRQATITLIIVSLVNLLNYYDRMLVVVVSQPLRIEFRLTDTQYGMLTGPAFVLVYVLSNLIFGWLSDRYSRRGAIAFVLTGWSVMTALCGTARSFVLLAAARAGVGIGEGGSNPACVSLLSDYYPPQRRTFALAMFNAGGMLGLFLSFVLGGWVATHHGWRAVFYSAAVPGVLLAIVVLVFLREPRRAGGTDRPQHSYRVAVRELARNQPFIWLAIAGAIGTFGSLGMVVWLPQFFLRSFDLTVQQVGLFFGPTGALGLFCGILAGGWLGDRLAQRSLSRPLMICIANNLAIVPLYLIVLWVPSLPLALIATFVAMATSTMSAPIIQAAVQNVSAPQARATAVGVFNVVVGVIGQGALPLSVGVASDALMPVAGTGSLRLALTLSTVYMLVSGLLFIRVLRLTAGRLG